MHFLPTLARWQDSCIPSEHNLTRSCRSAIETRLEGDRSDVAAACCMMCLMPVAGCVGAVQSGIKFACHITLACAGQKHELSQSFFELVKIIGVIATSIPLYAALFFPSCYQTPKDLISCEISENSICVGPLKDSTDIESLLNPRGFGTISFGQEAFDYPNRFATFIQGMKHYKCDRVVIEGEKALKYMLHRDRSCFINATVLVLKNITLNVSDLEQLKAAFPKCKAFDCKDATLSGDYESIKETHILRWEEGKSNLSQWLEKWEARDISSNTPLAAFIQMWRPETGNLVAQVRQVKQHFPKCDRLDLTDQFALKPDDIKALAQLGISKFLLDGCDGLHESPAEYAEAMAAFKGKPHVFYKEFSALPYNMQVKLQEFQQGKKIALSTFKD